MTYIDRAFTFTMYMNTNTDDSAESALLKLKAGFWPTKSELRSFESKIDSRWNKVKKHIESSDACFKRSRQC